MRERSSTASSSPHAPDPRQTRITGPVEAGLLDPLSVRLLDSFDVTDYATERLRPGSPHLAVGKDHVVTVNHMAITWTDKDGSARSYTKLVDFFAGLEPSAATAIDPRVQYDPIADRFVVSAADVIQGPKKGPSDDVGRILLAVSDDGDPNGIWYRQAIDVSGTVAGQRVHLDYPLLGIGKEALYISGNLFAFAPGSYSSFDHVWVVDKGAGRGGLYDGGSSAYEAIRPGTATGSETNALIFPATLTGPPYGDEDMYLVSYGLGIRPDKATGDLPIRIIAVDEPLAEGGPEFVLDYALPDIDAGRVPGGNPVPQPDWAPRLAGGIFGTVPHDVAWHGDTLYLATVLEPKDGPDQGQSTVHWLEIDASDPADYRILDQGSIGGEELAPGTETYLPSIDVNERGDIAIGFVASGPSLKVGTYVTGRASDDPAGTTRVPIPVREGEILVGVGESRTPRWGDYSGTVADPVDGSFWTHNAHAGSTYWQSTIGHLVLD